MNDRLIVLGTGNAAVTRCYNTCFALDFGADGLILCDAGGGNGILRQLEDAGVAWERIHHMIITHAHTDHLLGVVWVLRMVATRMNNGKYQGQLHIHCDPGVRDGLVQMAKLTLQKKMVDRIGNGIVFHDISDGSRALLAGREVTFFDIRSTKMKQFGFCLSLSDGQKLCCLGDEPYNPDCRPYVNGADWLLCEAFCLYGDRDVFKPYEKHHTTVKEACELAQQLKAPHLVLWHTEDKHITDRKRLYMDEARAYYTGDVHVPDDLDVIPLRRLDNHDRRIRFVDLLMERPTLGDLPECGLPDGYRFVFYQDGDRDAWIDIEWSAKELLSYEHGLEVWQRYYGGCEEMLSKRMLFIEDAQGRKVATATAYPGDEPGLGQVHWVAIRRNEQGSGLARPLIARVLRLMRELGDERAMLHTQTITWVAVRLYMEAGFVPTRESARAHREGWRIMRALADHPALAAFDAAEDVFVK